MRAAGGGQAVRRAIADAPEQPEGPSLLSMIVEGFGLALRQVSFLPGCEPCVERHIRAEHAHGVAVGNARAAAEEPPAADLPGIMQSVTQQDGRWVCMAHYELREQPAAIIQDWTPEQVETFQREMAKHTGVPLA